MFVVAPTWRGQQVAPQHELITVNVGTVGSTQLFPVNYEATKVRGSTTRHARGEAGPGG
jgi:hypothetical protein